MRLSNVAAVVLLSIPLPQIAAQKSANQKPATVEEARAFLDSANAELLELTTEASHAEWTAETDITEDTEATSALVNEQATAHTLELTAESHRFDHLQLPAGLRRQIMLLQVVAP